MDALAYSIRNDDTKKGNTLKNLANEEDHDNTTGRIIIHPNSNNSAMSTFAHKLVHDIERSKESFKMMRQSIFRRS